MGISKSTVWDYCENYVAEPPQLMAARQAALELGADPISPGTGALLRVTAALRDAKSVVEVGTGAGVSGLWALTGMNPRGVLTTIDPESEFQHAAAQAFKAAGVPSTSSRFINGRALDVLPRLADNSYDMFILDGPPEETEAYLTHAARLLRSSGALVLPNALWFGQVADPARRDPHTVMLREATRKLLESEEFRTTMVPSGHGVALASRRARE